MREQEDGSTGPDGDWSEAHELASLLAVPPAEVALIPSRLRGLLLAHVRMAREDSLTGVANRRGIDDRLAHEWERARRHHRPLSIILLDVDNLKEVNDEHGHAAGDDVLRAVAQELKASVRSIDFVGRTGGDEFLVICTESDSEAAAVVARKITAQLSAPVSLGFATLQPEQTLQHLLITADQDLYNAKTTHHAATAAQPLVRVLRRPNHQSNTTEPVRVLNGVEANGDRALFSPALAAMLTGVDIERLRAWRAAGLIGATGDLEASDGKRCFSFQDLRAIDALKALLDEEVDARTGHLRTALRAKSDFMRLVAHELRAPMTVIRGYISLLAGGALEHIREAGIDPLAVMDSRVAEMDHLAEQMLEIARLEDGRMLLQEQRLDLRLVVRDAVRTAALGARPKTSVRLVLPEEEIPVVGDAPRLLTIVSNLISNAIKYSPGEDEIECAAAIEGSTARLRVTDRGVGIDAADYERLFKPFERLRSSVVAGGTGLGLYICRELARRHGGDLVAAPAQPCGTTFVLELPVAVLS